MKVVNKTRYKVANVHKARSKRVEGSQSRDETCYILVMKPVTNL